jgi:cyanophycinase
VIRGALGPLALVGGDELNPGNEPHDEILVAAAGDGPAFVLATAAARQRPELAVANAKRWFARFGLEIRELPATKRSDATSTTNVELAHSGRFFYLVGGDPGLVPKTLSGTPLWDAIVGAWRSGAAVAGSSAGAMALGEWTLVRNRFPGDTKRWYRPALGLVPRVALIPHFDTFGSQWVESALVARPGDDAVLVGGRRALGRPLAGGRLASVGPRRRHDPRERRRPATRARRADRGDSPAGRGPPMMVV